MSELTNNIEILEDFRKNINKVYDMNEDYKEGKLYKAIQELINNDVYVHIKYGLLDLDGYLVEETRFKLPCYKIKNITTPQINIRFGLNDIRALEGSVITL